ncbi:MAG: chemotaxis protein CheW [Leptospiraceae bacterium]|nr:chemotaxis protein CheW [Leptospiraceae bacterium]
MDLDQSEREAFASEISDRLEEFGEFLLDFETARDNAEILHKLFRVAHTIKGNAGFVGLTNMVRIAHVSENLLARIRDGEIRLDQNLANLLFGSADLIRAILNAFIEGSPDPLSIDVTEQAGQIETALAAFQGAAVPPGAAESSEPAVTSAESIALSPTAPQQVRSSQAADLNLAALQTAGIDPDCGAWQITIRLKDAVALPGMRAYLLFSKLQKVVRAIWSLPVQSELEHFANEGPLLFWVQVQPDQVDLPSVLRNHEIESLTIDPLDPAGLYQRLQHHALIEAAPMHATGDQPGGDGDQAAVSDLDTDLITIEAEPGGGSGEQNASDQLLFASGAELSQTAGGSSIASQLEALKVPIKKVDDILNLVGELLSANSAYLTLAADYRRQFGNRGLYVHFRDNSEELGRIANELQEKVMRIRMIPVGTVFNRFRRLVRDYQSQNPQKQLQLQISGEDTEVDKKQIDNLYDPLMHLIRNALDHGMETSAERAAQQKPLPGTIQLHSYQDGNSIFIEVKDDGRGLQEERIRAKALERGLVSTNDLAAMSREELHNLIFLPGFSTAQSVSEVSGRGVGMDVVRRNIESIGGVIQLHSEPGKGSQFMIKLPLSMAVVTALKIYVADRLMAIPISVILETTKVRESDISLIENTETIKLRDEYVSLIRLDQEMGLPLPERSSSSKHPVVIVQFSSSRVALMVDELIGYEDMVIKSLSRNYEDIDGIAGAALLGRGEICLILDIQRLIYSILERHNPQQGPADTPLRKDRLASAALRPTAPGAGVLGTDATKPVGASRFTTAQLKLFKSIVNRMRRSAHQSLCKLTGNQGLQMRISETRLQSMQRFQARLEAQCQGQDCHVFYTQLEGDLTGHTLVLINTENIYRIARMLYQVDQPFLQPADPDKEIAMEVRSAIEELTNILSVSFTNTVSTISDLQLLPGPPQILSGYEQLFGRGILQAQASQTDVLLVETGFAHEDQSALLWFYIIPQKDGLDKIKERGV